MFGILEQENGVPVHEDEGVRCASKAAQEARALVNQLELDERRLLLVLNPLPNSPDPAEAAREEAWRRLDIRKGTQHGWYLPELVTARVELKEAESVLRMARFAAIERLDGARRPQRKRLVEAYIGALEMLFTKMEAVHSFDCEWDADRNASEPLIERTPLEPILSAGQIQNLKTILRAQGWL